MVVHSENVMSDRFTESLLLNRIQQHLIEPFFTATLQTSSAIIAGLAPFPFTSWQLRSRVTSFEAISITPVISLVRQ